MTDRRPRARRALLLGFARALRAAGLPVTADREAGYLEAVAVVGLDDEVATYWAGRATLCASPDDIARYDQVFATWFTHRLPGSPTVTPQAPPVGQASLDEQGGEGGRRSRRRAAAGDGQRDRGAAAPRRRPDVARREGRAHRASSAPCDAPTRAAGPRAAASGTAGEIDARRTLRRQLQRMGEPGRLEWRRRGTRPRRVVMLVDVSGSMSSYADSLLRLAHRWSVGRHQRRGVHHGHPAHPRDPRDAAARPRAGARSRPATPSPTGPAAPGSVRRSRHSSTAGDSEGWPAAPSSSSSATAGSAAASTSSTSRCGACARLAHRVVWVNPHRGKAGYQPIQQGIVAALPALSTTSSPVTRWRTFDGPGGGGRRMRDVLPDLLRWWRDGASVGVGTVVATWRSAPRQPGASMLVGPEGEAVGSVSGGCVEGAVYELAQEVVESGDAGTPALRRQRRGRVRRRSHLRRHPRRLGRDRVDGRPSPSSARSPPTSRPAGRSRWRPWSSTRIRPGSAGG